MHALLSNASASRLLSEAWFASPHWPTMGEIDRHLTFFRQFPDYFWLLLVVGLFLIAMRHAKDRQLREQARFSEELGWNFSKDWSPIGEEDWRQLSQNANLAALSWASNRKNFTFGTHLGTTFALFEAPGGVRSGADERTPETMIGFQKPSDLPAAPSMIAGGGIGVWERFVTDHWVFFRPNPPRWVLRGPQAEAFVKEAYAQMSGI
jgi:hypothetical protein